MPELASTARPDHRRPTARLAVLTAATALLLLSCSGSDGGGRPSAGPASTTAAGPSAPSATAATTTARDEAAPAREAIEVDVDGDAVVGHLTHPGAAVAPSGATIVMAHGLGLLQSSGLQPFVDAFAAAGHQVVTFDYRSFGESEGEPRQLIDPARQLDDWRTVVAAVRERGDVDPDRIVLWGTSFSGGHVLAVGAEDARLAAVVAQVPHVDGAASAAAVGPDAVQALIRLAVLDRKAADAGRERVPVALVGAEGTVSLMPQPGSQEGYLALIGGDPSWHDATPALAVTSIASYSPAEVAGRSTVPTFIGVATGDLVTPPEPAVALAGSMGADLHTYDGGHFDVYRGPLFDHLVADELAFLDDVLA